MRPDEGVPSFVVSLSPRTNRRAAPAGVLGRADRGVLRARTVADGPTMVAVNRTPRVKEPTMSTLHLHQTTTATPEQFLAELTDFGPDRSTIFPNSQDQYLQVHSTRPAS
jgi:hypothetical protein